MKRNFVEQLIGFVIMSLDHKLAYCLELTIRVVRFVRLLFLLSVFVLNFVACFLVVLELILVFQILVF